MKRQMWLKRDERQMKPEEVPSKLSKSEAKKQSDGANSGGKPEATRKREITGYLMLLCIVVERIYVTLTRYKAKLEQKIKCERSSHNTWEY